MVTDNDMKRLELKLARIYCLIAFMVLGCAAAPVFSEEELNSTPFVSGSLEKIVASRQGRPFMLVMWSRECASCMKELAMLAESRLENPALDIVTIATDQVVDPQSLGRLLQSYRLEGVDSWYFSESDSNRLRYEVDSAWYGEIPRTYLYDEHHARVAVSGVLKPEQLQAWMAVASSR